MRYFDVSYQPGENPVFCYRTAFTVYEEQLVGGALVSGGWNTAGYPLNVLSNCPTRLDPHKFAEPFAREETVSVASLGGEFRFEYDGYTVTVNGRPCPVQLCRESAVPFNQTWPGYQRPLDQTEEAGYITFSADEEVPLRVECAAAFERATVRPLSKGVEGCCQGNAVEFTLKEHGGYVLELDDYHHYPQR